MISVKSFDCLLDRLDNIVEAFLGHYEQFMFGFWFNNYHSAQVSSLVALVKAVSVLFHYAVLNDV